LLQPGIFNGGDWKSDAFFGRARLTFFAEYITKADSLPFPLSNTRIQNLLDKRDSLDSALKKGRIFVEDQSTFIKYKPFLLPGRYIGFSTGIFYFSESRQELVPLAIRVDVESGLIVTPNDGAEEWLFAKMALNAISTWRLQWIDHFTENVIMSPFLSLSLRKG
jgi:hypothetical protein